MAATKETPADLLEQLRRDREKIASELPELLERGRRLDEAAAENSLSGNLRRAVHHSRQPLKKVAAEIGIDVLILCDFLEGTRTLRSDVLDRCWIGSPRPLELRFVWSQTRKNRSGPEPDVGVVE